jgi:hypothetical protein
VGRGAGAVSIAAGFCDVTCPFCDGKYGFFEGPDGQSGVLHTPPYCPKFEAEAALIFLRNARLAKGFHLPDDDEWPATGGGHE